MIFRWYKEKAHVYTVPRPSSHPSDIGFGEMMVSWRSTESWHCERLGKATGEGAARVALEAPRLKASWRKVEALKLWTIKESRRGYWWMCSPAAVEDSSISRCGLSTQWSSTVGPWSLDEWNWYCVDRLALYKYILSGEVVQRSQFRLRKG